MGLKATALQLATVVSSNYIAQTFGCVITGNMSDVVGRKPVVIGCLLGTVVSHIMVARVRGAGFRAGPHDDDHPPQTVQGVHRGHLLCGCPLPPGGPLLRHVQDRGDQVGGNGGVPDVEKAGTRSRRRRRRSGGQG
ncbi:unnamed protein product [Ectocarpus fasciculatus]